MKKDFLIILCLLLAGCGGGRGNGNPLLSSKNNITPNLNLVSIATGSYVFAQKNSSQTIYIPIANNSGASVNISLLKSNVSPVTLGIGNCNVPLVNGQICTITATLSGNQTANNTSGSVTAQVMVNNTQLLNSLINYVVLTSALPQPNLYSQDLTLIASPGQTVYSSLTFVNANTTLENKSQAIESQVVTGGNWSMVADYCGSNIAANTTCSIIVSYTANSSFVSSNSINNQPAVQVTKAGASAELYALAASNQGVSQLVISPSSLNIYNSSNDTVKLTLSNSGNIPITSLNITPIHGLSINSSKCIDLLPLNPLNQQICQLSVQVTNISQATPLTINYADAESSSKSTTITINPFALQSALNSYKFITFESNSVTTNITLTNAGSKPITLGSLEDNTAYGNIDLADCPSTINPGSNITCQLIFLPTSTGTGIVTANLPWKANGNEKNLLLTFHIEVNDDPILVANPTSLNFAQNIVGQPESKTFILMNNGNTNINSLTLINSSALTTAGFNVLNLCNGNISAGGSCEVTLTYNPSNQESAIASLPLNFSYQYTTKKGETYTVNKNNLLQVNYSTGWAPDVVCATSSASISLGTIYYGDPNSTAESSITCTNIGGEPALVNWESGTSLNGFTVSPALPQTITGNGGSITLSFTANPFTSTAGATIISPTIIYKGTISDITGNTLLASSISYKIAPWFSASLSNCNNVTCNISIINNSPDMLELNLPQSVVGLNQTLCGEINGDESCTISYTLNPNSFTSLNTDKISNFITIASSNFDSSQPLSYNFNYTANQILYMGGNFNSGFPEANYLAYYKPAESAINTYCYLGAKFGICKGHLGNSLISSLLYNPYDGGLYIGTQSMDIGGTMVGGKVYDYLGNGLTNPAKPLGYVVNSCTINNQGNCSTNSLALITNFSNDTLSPIAATPIGFFQYLHGQWQLDGFILPALSANNTIVPIPGNTSNFLAVINNNAYEISGGALLQPALFPSGLTPITALTVGLINGQPFFFTAFANSTFIEINSLPESSSSTTINGIESSEVVNGIKFIPATTVNGSNELLVTTKSNAYYAVMTNGNWPTSFSKIQNLNLQQNEQITASVLNINGEIYLGTNQGRLFHLANALSTPTLIQGITQITNNEAINAMVLGYTTWWKLTYATSS